MTYSNDSNKKNNMRDEGSYTGWIVGGLLALAVIVAIFAFGRNGSQTDTADNNRGELFSDDEPTITGGSACHYGLSGYYKHVPSGHEPINHKAV